jgi:hypothetical protein
MQLRRLVTNILINPHRIAQFRRKAAAVEVHRLPPKFYSQRWNGVHRLLKICLGMKLVGHLFCLLIRRSSSRTGA